MDAGHCIANQPLVLDRQVGMDAIGIHPKIMAGSYD